MKLKDIVQYAHEKHMLQLLPVPVALSIRAFFMTWPAFGECPAFFMREKVMEARLQDEHSEKPYAVVIELRETIAHAARETVLEKICTEDLKVLHSILSYLDQSGNGCTALLGVKALWEVGGCLLAGSDEAEVCTAFIMACKDRGIDTAPRCFQDAFVEGFPHMPFSADIAATVDNDCYTPHPLEAILTGLVSGPNVGSQYLPVSKVWDVASYFS